MRDYRRSDSQPRTLYRSRKDRVFLGVCGGLAEYFDFNLTALRVLTFILIFFTNLFGLLCYVIAGFVMKPAPLEEYDGPPLPGDFYKTARRSPATAIDRIQSRFDQLDKRLQKMEDIVTSDHGNLEEEFRKLQREA